jgi:hypothetical protein
VTLAVGLHDFQQPRPPVGGEGQAGRVLVIARAVDELHSFEPPLAREAREQPFDLVDDHAVGVHRDGQYRRAERLERPGVNEVARVGGDDDVARVDKHVADEVKRLLRAGRDDEVVLRQRHLASGDAFELLDVGQQPLAQVGEAEGGVVLQCLPAARDVGEDAARDGVALLDGERQRVDQAGGEVDQPRVPQRLGDEEADRLFLGSQRLGRQRQPGEGVGRLKVVHPKPRDGTRRAKALQTIGGDVSVSPASFSRHAGGSPLW